MQKYKIYKVFYSQPHISTDKPSYCKKVGRQWTSVDQNKVTKDKWRSFTCYKQVIKQIVSPMLEFNISIRNPSLTPLPNPTLKGLPVLKEI